MRDMDHVITTRELALWIKERGIDFESLSVEGYDKFMGTASGGGVIFGNTGGVMEAAARAAYFMITGENPGKEFLDLQPVRGMNGIRSATVNIGGVDVRLAVVHGLDNAKHVLDEMNAGKCEFDFLEVMTCRGGCIGGGGQPKALEDQREAVRRARIKALYDMDRSMEMRSSYENPEIQALYKNFYDKPLSPIAERLLHTHYHSRESDLGEKGGVEKTPSSKALHISIDVMMMLSLLVLLVSPIIIGFIRGGGGAFPEWSPYRNIHMLAGWILAGLTVIHIVINYRQILSVVNIASVPTITKLQYLMMCLMLIFLIIAIVTGAVWGNQGLAASIATRQIHSLSAWLAFIFTGIHAGLNMGKLTSYASIRKSRNIASRK
jgi:hypothetical protein